MGRFRRFWSGGVSFFRSIGKDDASCYRLRPPLCLGVRSATLRGVRNAMLFAPYGHHVPSWERIQGYFSPTRWGICLLKMCIFYSLDRRSEYVFARMWKRTSWRARRYAGCLWGRHGCLWDAIWVNKYAEESARFLTTRAEVTTFSLLRHAPPCTRACESRKTVSLKISESLISDQFGHGKSESGP
jgi:hypothetical protein